MESCKLRPGTDGTCPTNLFKSKKSIGLMCCRKIIARDPPCALTKRDKLKHRRFISPITRKCVTERGKSRSQRILGAYGMNKTVPQQPNQLLLEFGRRKRYRRNLFGSSVCTGLIPKDTPTCMNYTENDLYPCVWSGGTNNRCQKRPGVSVPRSVASSSGIYSKFINKFTQPEPSIPFVPTQQTWFPKENSGKFVQYESPFSESIFGYNQKLKKIKKCSYVKRRGCKSKHLYTKGTSLAFGKKRRIKTRSAKCLPARIIKMCRKLKIKVTKKIGKRRVYKSLSVIKKQIAKKMKIKRVR